MYNLSSTRQERPPSSYWLIDWLIDSQPHCSMHCSHYNCCVSIFPKTFFVNREGPSCFISRQSLSPSVQFCWRYVCRGRQLCACLPMSRCILHNISLQKQADENNTACRAVSASTIQWSVYCLSLARRTLVLSHEVCYQFTVEQLALLFPFKL